MWMARCLYQTLEFARAQTSTLEWNTASDSTQTADAERYRYAMKEAAGDPDSPTFEPGEKLVRCDVLDTEMRTQLTFSFHPQGVAHDARTDVFAV